MKLRGLEAIAKAADRDQEDRFVGFYFDLLAQAADMDVDCAWCHKMLLAPDLPQQLLA